MVVPVIDDVAESVPVMVTVYVPFATVGVLLGGGGGVELPPPQPDAASPITTKMHALASIARLRDRRPTNPATSSPAIIKTVCAAA